LIYKSGLTAFTGIKRDGLSAAQFGGTWAELLMEEKRSF